MENFDWLNEQLRRFGSRYYFNSWIKRMSTGILFFIILVLFFALLEYQLWFSATYRKVFFIFILISFSVFFIFFLCWPLLQWLGFRRKLQQRDFARIIGRHFSEINDRIINTLELHSQLNDHYSHELVSLAIEKKIEEIKPYRFINAIPVKQLKRVALSALITITIASFLGFAFPEISVDSIGRILNFEKEYQRPAPFHFVLQNNTLQVEQNADFDVKLLLEGRSVPQEVRIFSEGRSALMDGKNGQFSYRFSLVKNDFDFYFNADDFTSDTFHVKVFRKPVIQNYFIKATYPAYLNKTSETFTNLSEILVPHGTYLQFFIQSKDEDGMKLALDGKLQKILRNGRYYSFNQTVTDNARISVVPYNSFSSMSDSLIFNVSSIADEYPVIRIEEITDSMLFYNRYFNGYIRDDYGFTELEFSYRKILNDSVIKGKYAINISPDFSEQDFYFNFDFTRLDMAPGERIEYFFTVYDNDGFLGPKAVNSNIFSFKMPTSEELEAIKDQSFDKFKDKLDKTLQDTRKNQADLQKLLDEMKMSKQNKNEQQEKARQLLEQQKSLQNQVENLKEESKAFTELQNSNAPDPEMAEKLNELNKLFEQVLSEEMKEQIRHLEEMLDKMKLDQKQLEELNKNNEDLKKALDRQLEMLKRFEVEDKLNKSIENLKQLAEQQKQLATENEKSKTTEEIKQQNELQDKFNEELKKIDSLKQMNEKLEVPFSIPEQEQQKKEINQKMNESQNELKKGNQDKAGKNQREAGEKMEQMAEEMEQMMNEQSMEEMAEDVLKLRALLENLIKSSFGQEDLLRLFSMTKTNDPKYVDNMKGQKDLINNFKMIEDSLFALSKRQPQISNAVNKEIATIRDASEKTYQEMGYRRLPNLLPQQQLIMTSANNLALMLAESLQNMQQSMNSKMNGQGNKQCKSQGNKPGQKSGKPSAKTLRQLQEQLNQQMEQLGKRMQSGEKGKAINEELAKMAAQQEAIRKAMQELQQQMNSEGMGQKNGSSQKAINDMEKTEKDLYNKIINLETINRQKEIMVRLLDSEKAEMEREKEEKRQSTTGKDINNGNPMQNFEYKRLSRNENEVLKNRNAVFNSFYRQKTTEYFYKMR